MGITDEDLAFLERAVALAREAAADGDGAFGSVLVDDAGVVRFADRNRETSLGDETRHPEFEIARWAATNLTGAERASATVYTSGEHCPMCSAAHAWVGLGRIVYAASAAQIAEWRRAAGMTPSAVAVLAITTVAPGLVVDGPVERFAGELRSLLVGAAPAS
ncbi:nucleoside deaminase [Agromyces cerinus]|uniref:Cytidine and deoxycytidylate deaminase zinc-binding region n=1 Tax=Agromyces cerinus subsp. cerinus TaxID=232089 RepID=A0A1N6DXC2_9MICO|nr:nucleoside deaminase [Agromyces cerinus]SIN75410.1 Cytidine and deoxycytidylate deaminase zinc-binding region [Agromyces cerinus subsp. cerinus]